MNFFGLGIWEIVFILLIVLVVVGPERLPRLARQLGLFVAQVQGWLQRSPDAQLIMQARRELEREINNLRSELVAMQQAQQQLVASAQQAINEPLAALKAAQDDISADLKSIGAAVEAESSPGAAVPEPPLNGSAAADAALIDAATSQPAAEPGATPDGDLASAAPVDPAASGATLDGDLVTAAPANAAAEPVSDIELLDQGLTAVPELKAVPRSTRPFPATSGANAGLPTPQLIEPPTMPEPVCSEASSDRSAAVLGDEADLVADLVQQAEAVTVAGQFEALALRLQMLANDLASLQQELQHRGLLDSGLSAAQNSLSLTQDSYAEALAGSSGADKQL